MEPWETTLRTPPPPNRQNQLTGGNCASRGRTGRGGPNYLPRYDWVGTDIHLALLSLRGSFTFEHQYITLNQARLSPCDVERKWVYCVE